MALIMNKYWSHKCVLLYLRLSFRSLTLALEHSLFGAKESSGVGDQFSARKLRFELDLQDGVLTKASPMLGRMKILATFARRAGNAPQSDLWEGRIEEMDSIILTSGKKTAAAYARSFFSGSNGLSSQHVIELNKRAKQCYRASRRNHSSSSELTPSSDSDPRRKRRAKGGSARTARPAVKSPGVSCFTCGLRGHVSSSCPSRTRQFQPRGATASFKRKCLICEDTAHIAVKCPLNPVNIKK